MTNKKSIENNIHEIFSLRWDVTAEFYSAINKFIITHYTGDNPIKEGQIVSIKEKFNIEQFVDTLVETKRKIGWEDKYIRRIIPTIAFNLSYDIREKKTKFTNYYYGKYKDRIKVGLTFYRKRYNKFHRKDSISKP